MAPPVLQADLTDPTSLPATLVGISAIIDCATARPEESTQKVDWEGKVALIQCAQVGGRGVGGGGCGAAQGAGWFVSGGLQDLVTSAGSGRQSVAVAE